MLRKTNAMERMLLISISFTLLLVTVRIIYTQDLMYVFYYWNIFLAIIPYCCSRLLNKKQSVNFKTVCILAVWLLFFPNAPYIITDIFHFEKRPPIPFWFDLTIVVTGAWNGLLLGILSLMQVEKWLSGKLSRKLLRIFVLLCIALSGYGVYIGRFLRYNSWDILTRPLVIIYSFGNQIIHPHQHIGVWSFTVVFSLMMVIIYETLKQLPVWVSGTEKRNYMYKV